MRQAHLLLPYECPPPPAAMPAPCPGPRQPPQQLHAPLCCPSVAVPTDCWPTSGRYSWPAASQVPVPTAAHTLRP
eukprot:1161944-Pelagomonas_calceolata.AAC.14